ncbi:DNA recombination protein RmuC [Cellvibrio japonicus]|uniref:RmuC domain protein family n=1 Tax=Cellvibrio japonicus (strain Ueda107) TaxID=498211 RepID=B3PJ77_CELJU|nr:DNA recombination protein RmuC [Cellvibrio japonicus]ACE82869.1 RmuC domain protein family [Cellvibrio japonicus Ueda107]QEI12633.1 DNA recombination protein RmuC [Cellvibrio japonicus]QEI16207.1 DNA recombination protein RmuC [Cellvibrio japonicus]QEI19785.1 DNA recombination protein RmuC [Cellvibrio japonicus]
MTQSWLFILAALGGFMLGALVVYFWMQQRLQSSAQREQAGSLRLAALEAETNQLRNQVIELRGQWQQAQHEQQLLQNKLMQLTEELAGQREKAARLPALEADLQGKQQLLSELEQTHAALVSRTEQERRNFAEQLALLQSARTDLTREFENLAGKIFEAKQQQFQHNSKSLLDTTLDPLRSQLTEFRKKVEDVYEKESAERNRLAGQVLELQKQAQKIGEDAISLAQALKGNSKTQGNWGEVVLERLLEESGLQKGREYDAQVNFTATDGSRRMPDVIVHLPEQKDIVIDAKCSLSDYEKYCSTEDESSRKQYLAAHIQSLRNHIKQLSIKDYEKIDGIKSLDFVFIFIPIEAAFMLALQEDPGLYREAYDRHIILVSPTTLLATLRTVENIWRYEKQNKNAERIAREAGALHDQFVLMLDALDSVGNQLHKTQEAYAKARERLASGRGNLIKRVDDIRRLGAKTKKVISGTVLEEAGVESVDLLLDDTSDTE